MAIALLDDPNELRGGEAFRDTDTLADRDLNDDDIALREGVGDFATVRRNKFFIEGIRAD